MRFDAEILSGFTSGASFGNLSKVSVPAAGWWRLFLTGEGVFGGGWSLSDESELIFISQRANFSARYGQCQTAWSLGEGNTNNLAREILTWHHLASGVFSPGIRCPVGSGLKLAWHDWLKWDQSKTVFFWQFNQLREYSRGFLLFRDEWFRGLKRTVGAVLPFRWPWRDRQQI